MVIDNSKDKTKVKKTPAKKSAVKKTPVKKQVIKKPTVKKTPVKKEKLIDETTRILKLEDIITTLQGILDQKITDEVESIKLEQDFLSAEVKRLSKKPLLHKLLFRRYHVSLIDGEIIVINSNLRIPGMIKLNETYISPFCYYVLRKRGYIDAGTKTIKE